MGERSGSGEKRRRPIYQGGRSTRNAPSIARQARGIEGTHDGPRITAVPLPAPIPSRSIASPVPVNLSRGAGRESGPPRVTRPWHPSPVGMSRTDRTSPGTVGASHAVDLVAGPVPRRPVRPRGRPRPDRPLEVLRRRERRLGPRPPRPGRRRRPVRARPRRRTPRRGEVRREIVLRRGPREPRARPRPGRLHARRLGPHRGIARRRPRATW